MPGHLLYLLVRLSRGGVPLLNILLDHYLANQDPAGLETNVTLVDRSRRAAMDILGLDFQSQSFAVE